MGWMQLYIHSSNYLQFCFQVKNNSVKLTYIFNKNHLLIEKFILTSILLFKKKIGV